MIQRKTIRTHNIVTFVDQLIEAAQQGYVRDNANFPRKSMNTTLIAYLLKSDVNDVNDVNDVVSDVSVGKPEVVGDKPEVVPENANTSDSKPVTATLDESGTNGTDSVENGVDELTTQPVADVSVKKAKTGKGVK